MPRIASDLTDLLDFFVGNRTPMGVPRVQMALLEAGIAADAPPIFAPIAFHHPTGSFRAVPLEPLRDFLTTARLGGARDDPDWIAARAALDAAHAAAAEAAPARDGWVFSGAPPFHVPGQMRRLRELRRASGARLAVLVHDTIPLVAPEHCSRELAQGFARNFLALCLQTDRVVATSAAAARDFRDCQQRLLPGIAIPAWRMPLDAPLPALAVGEPPPLPPPLDDGRDYVLCVSTIEARKDQVLLLRAWITLLRRHGPRAVPCLVLVGRTGYGAEAALRLLENTPELRRHAIWLPEVSDALLARLYRGCLFAVFNSFYEGWGLPVTEALSHGKLVLAPDHSSLREAGGNGALYFTPNSEPELVDLAWSLIRDPGRRAALEASLPGRVRLRGWRAVAEGLAAELDAPVEPLPSPFGRAGWVPGRRLPLGNPPPGSEDLPPDPFALVGECALEGEAWGLTEPPGVWLTHGPGWLRLPRPEGMALRLFLEVLGPPMPITVPLRVTAGGVAGEWRVLRLAPAQSALVELEVPAGPACDVLVEFDTREAALPGEAAPHEQRRLCLLLQGIFLCDAADAGAAWGFLAARAGLVRPQQAVQ